MSEPQSRETWPEPKGGFGVEMTPEQFEILASKINFITEETTRREKAVQDSLDELKKIESVRTYASFVKDITTSIQTLSMLPNTENAREELLQSLHKVTATFVPNKELQFEEEKTLSLQTHTRTSQENEESGVLHEHKQRQEEDGISK